MEMRSSSLALNCRVPVFVYPWSTKEFTQTRSGVSVLSRSNWNLALTFCCLYSYRSRLQVLERKLMCLETFNNIYRALDQMRSSSVIPDTETNEEMRQRVTEECKWFV